MRNPIRLATVAGLAVLALAACTPEENDDSAADAPTPVESTSAPAEPDPTTDQGCDAVFDAETDDPIMEPYVGEWVSEEQSPVGADWPETSTICIEADGSVTYEAPQGVWEGHLTVGDEVAPLMELDQTEGTEGGHLLLDCNYTADEDTIGLVETGDDAVT